MALMPMFWGRVDMVMAGYTKWTRNHKDANVSPVLNVRCCRTKIVKRSCRNAEETIAKSMSSHRAATAGSAGMDAG